MNINRVLHILSIGSALLAPFYLYWWVSGKLSGFEEFVRFVGIFLIVTIFWLSTAALRDRTRMRNKSEPRN